MAAVNPLRCTLCHTFPSTEKSSNILLSSCTARHVVCAPCLATFYCRGANIADEECPRGDGKLGKLELVSGSVVEAIRIFQEMEKLGMEVDQPGRVAATDNLNLEISHALPTVTDAPRDREGEDGENTSRAQVEGQSGEVVNVTKLKFEANVLLPGIREVKLSSSSLTERDNLENTVPPLQLKSLKGPVLKRCKLESPAKSAPTDEILNHNTRAISPNPSLSSTRHRTKRIKREIKTEDSHEDEAHRNFSTEAIVKPSLPKKTSVPPLASIDLCSDEDEALYPIPSEQFEAGSPSIAPSSSSLSSSRSSVIPSPSNPSSASPRSAHRSNLKLRNTEWKWYGDYDDRDFEFSDPPDSPQLSRSSSSKTLTRNKQSIATPTPKNYSQAAVAGLTLADLAKYIATAHADAQKQQKAYRADAAKLQIAKSVREAAKKAGVVSCLVEIGEERARRMKNANNLADRNDRRPAGKAIAAVVTELVEMWEDGGD